MRSLASPMAALAVAATVSAQSSPDPSAFTAGILEVDGQVYPYRLLEPLPELRDVPRPLVVFLHGAGERGADNVAQLRWLPEVLAQPANRTAHPCFVLAVQCPTAARWVEVPWADAAPQPLHADPTPALRAVLRQLDVLVARPDVDAARVYLTGLSMGGFGAFDLVAPAPERFAAVPAVCGGGAPATAERLVDVPFQVWHGAADRVVPVQRSRLMVEALGRAGAAVDYHELPEVGHDAWRQAYGPDGFAWLFGHDLRQQRRGPFVEPACVPAVTTAVPAEGRFAVPERLPLRVAASLREHVQVLPELLGLPVDWLPESDRNSAGQPGDCVFAVEPGSADAFTITVADRVTVTARDAQALARAAIALAQLVRAAGDRGVPCGMLAQSLVAHGNRVVLPEGAARLGATELVALLHECRWFGVDEVAVGWADGTRFTGDVADRAKRLGLRLCAREEPMPARALVADADLQGWLRLPRPEPASAPCAFCLRVPEGIDDGAGMLEYARARLPAASERAHRTGALSAASLRSRVARLRRS